MASDDTHRFYRPSRNPDRGSFPGVPLRDLTKAEYEAQPEWVQASIDGPNSPYQASAPTSAEKRADTIQQRAWEPIPDAPLDVLADTATPSQE